MKLIITISLIVGLLACAKKDNEREEDAPKDKSTIKQEADVLVGEKAINLLAQKYNSIKLVCKASITTLVDESGSETNLSKGTTSIIISPKSYFLGTEKFDADDNGLNSTFATDEFEVLEPSGKNEIRLQVSTGIYEADVTFKLHDLQVRRDSKDWVLTSDPKNALRLVDRKDIPLLVVEYKGIITRHFSKDDRNTKTSTGKFKIEESYSGSTVEDETVTVESVEHTLSQRLRIRCNAVTIPI